MLRHELRHSHLVYDSEVKPAGPLDPAHLIINLQGEGCFDLKERHSGGREELAFNIYK